MKKQLITEIIVFLFVLLFFYAAGSKLVEYQKFIAQIGKSPLLTKYADTIAWVIPAVEMIIAVLLIIPRLRRWALYAAFGLMVMFTFYIIAILSFSKELPCSCGGILSMLGWKEHLLFNVVFVLLGLTGIVLMSQEEDANKIASI